jgi:hypothetical protein
VVLGTNANVAEISVLWAHVAPAIFTRAAMHGL